MKHTDSSADSSTDTSTVTTLNQLRVAITGGTSGLGLALVETLSAQGAQMAFVARTQARVDAVSERFPSAHGIVGDVCQKQAIYPMAMAITTALGGLDVLINNASSLGPIPLAPLADTECEDLELALNTNVLGPFRLTKALLGALAASARGGRPALVINISSDAAENAYAGWGAYSASKAALAHMSRIWHQELESVGVSVLAVDPGDMDTPLHALSVPDADPADLKPPAQAAAELVAMIETALAPAAPVAVAS